MDEAITRVRPYDLERLERARQRREDAAKTELIARRNAEREQEQAVSHARDAHKRAVGLRIERHAHIYAGIAARPITIGQLRNIGILLTRLEDNVAAKKADTAIAIEAHVRSTMLADAAKSHFNVCSHRRTIVSDLRKRVARVLAEKEESALETEMDDGTVDRFVTTSEPF